LLLTALTWLTSLLCGQSLVSGKKHYREIEFVRMRE